MSRSDTTEPDQRFFFVHLHKTAGTSLWRRMRQHFPIEQLFPNDDDGDPLRRTLSVEDLAERWPSRRDQVHVLAGHYPLCTREVLAERFTTLTLLRDPIERIASALREQRQKLPEFAESPYEEIYREPLRRLMLHNHMTKMFALTPATMTDGALTNVAFTASHRDAAIEGLATVNHVGFQDEFERFCDGLTADYGWRLGPPVEMNVSDPDPIPESLLDLIAEENALDIELYDWATSRFRTD